MRVILHSIVFPLNFLRNNSESKKDITFWEYVNTSGQTARIWFMQIPSISVPWDGPCSDCSVLCVFSPFIFHCFCRCGGVKSISWQGISPVEGNAPLIK